uniref:NADH-ubiquinone oxidoreductase chain 6 n=1 Tax=Paracladura trichoptera TaxID=1111055 RepID=G8J8J2_9DIPT|nr:NADH dehydrogenase subunit 6 [Paracladura trichoptera]AET13110.1 NADH dehydrogenase subunit 6 [Paracladura trichoptera]
MFNFIITSWSLMLNYTFIQLKHPLALGISLLIQTFFICLIVGTTSKTFWFSYTMFLIFLGGMLILFVYMTSLASNEMFSFSFKLLMYNILLLMNLYVILYISDKMMISSFMHNMENMMMNEYSFNTENSINLNKLYNYPTNMITIMMISYLFVTLIAIVKMTKIFKGSLRSNF